MNTTPPRVFQVNTSSGGIPKRPVQEGHVTDAGIEGDDWNDKRYHRFRDQAICLFYRKVRLGDVWNIGGHVSIRITKVRVPCRTIAVYGDGILRALYDDEVRRGNVCSTKWGRSGFYAAVLTAGTVRAGDRIDVQPVVLAIPRHDPVPG